MVTTFKENSSGGYYCAECRMSFGEPQATCPYCGSFVTNYEEIVSRPNLDTYATGGIISYDDVPILRGTRVNALCYDDYIGDELDHDLLKKIVEIVRKKENESNIHGTT